MLDTSELRNPGITRNHGSEAVGVFCESGFLCCQGLRFSQHDEGTGTSMINALPDEHVGAISTGRVDDSPTT
jgi:hypothetical protein